MKRLLSSGFCPVCGGARRQGRVTHAVDLGATLAVVRNVEADVCDQCGESWLADATVAHLERIVDDARARGAQVEVVSLP